MGSTLMDAMNATDANGTTFEEFSMALNKAPPNSTGREWGYRGETCCMCSKPLRNLGTLLFAVEDYNHDYGSHNAMWYCQQNCARKCRWAASSAFYGCYDERHLLDMNRRYSHRHGWNIWQERRGDIC